MVGGVAGVTGHSTSSAVRVVFSGGPGAGKTTVLQALQRQGYPVADDSARALIRARRGRPPPREFAKAVLQQDIAHYRQHGVRGPVFFERGVVDALGMLQALSPWPANDLQAMLRTYPYHRQVFIFPPWEAIYANDAQRDQTYPEAVRIGGLTADWYRHCGYEVIDVPRTTIEARCAFVLQVLARGDNA